MRKGSRARVRLGEKIRRRFEPVRVRCFRRPRFEQGDELCAGLGSEPAVVGRALERQAELKLLAKLRRLHDEARVVGRVRVCRRQRGQLVHSDGALDLLELPSLLELCYHRDGVGRLALCVQRDDRLPDDAVARPIEVARLKTRLLHPAQSRAARLGPQDSGTKKGP